MVVEQRHRDAKQTLKVRPVFLHNDDRIDALVAAVGIALLVFGLIEADLRRRLPAQTRACPACCPKAAPPSPPGRNILAAFQGLGATYTADGLVLDRSPPPNASSSRSSTSSYPGPNGETNPQPMRKTGLAGMADENVEEFTTALEGEAVVRPYLTRYVQQFADVTADDVAASLAGLVSDIDRAALTG